VGGVNGDYELVEVKGETMGPQKKWFLIGQVFGTITMLLGMWIGRTGRRG
jgi:hypothetical protein